MTKTFQPQDRFFQKAKEEGYRARSVYKLKDIQKRFHLIKYGDCVLDLGAAPGSFMQFIRKVVGEKGLVIGIDLTPIKPFNIPNVKSYVGDIFDEKIYEKILDENDISQFNVITSDLAPATTGIKSVDAGRSFQLSEQVLRVAEKYLKPGGNLVIKSFPGAEQNQLMGLMKNRFSKIKPFKPQAVRKSSRELYLIGISKRS